MIGRNLLETEAYNTKLLKGKKIIYKKDYEVDLTKENIAGSNEYVKNYDLNSFYNRIRAKKSNFGSIKL